MVEVNREIPSWIRIFKKWMFGTASFTLVFLVFQAGLRWHLPRPLAVVAVVVDYVVILMFVMDVILSIYFTQPRVKYFKSYWPELLVFLPPLLGIIPLQAMVGFVIIRHVLVLIRVFTTTRKFSNVLRKVRFNTAQVVVLSFMATIFIGTMLLTFPAATRDERGASLIDALFTATSATCVTGLIVQDTPVYFSHFGQMVILVLIQLGGLGIMTYSAFVALLLKKLSLGQRKIMQEMLEEEKNVYTMVFYIFKMTFFVEMLGAFLLFLRWNFVFHDPLKSLYYSVFHAVSAFCNAGFSTFSNSLENYVGDFWINSVIMMLIILGGLGFIVIYETSGQWKKRRLRLSTHSMIVLMTTGFLIILGFLVIFFVEFDRSLMKYPLPTRFLASLFQSVTARTAGFNTIPIHMLSPVTQTFMIVLMFIGASPGSTGGGIKTTTFAVLLLSVYSILRGRDEVAVFRRRIVTTSILKALALLVFVLVVISLIFGSLLISEGRDYLSLLFETVSAFGTVGLSTGLTPSLTITGKFLIVMMMFIGRIGPLTLGLALARETRKTKIDFPDARVLIG